MKKDVRREKILKSMKRDKIVFVLPRERKKERIFFFVCEKNNFSDNRERKQKNKKKMRKCRNEGERKRERKGGYFNFVCFPK